MATPILVTFRLRRDTAANWTAANPVLKLGEPGLETDTRKVKYGDGVTAWNALGYSLADPADADLIAIAALVSAADRLPYATGAGTWALATFTAAGRALVDDADATAQRATLGLGTMALQATTAYVPATGGTYSGRVTVTASEAFRAAAASPFWTFYNAAQTTRFGYVQHTGTDLAFVNEQVGNYDIYTSNVLRFRINASGHALPGTDNAYDLGSAAIRWRTVYAGTGTINTSDRRHKCQIGEIPDVWLDAWGDVPIVRFKFKDAVATKGKAARWHIGRVAQDVRDVFATHGLDAFELGLLCYDSWEAQPGRKGKAGGPRSAPIPPVPAVKAGDLFGLRENECAALDAAWQRRESGRLRDLVTSLQSNGR